MSTLRAEFDIELALGGLPNTLTNDAFKHQLDQKLSIARGQSVFEGLPTDHHYRPANRAGDQQANIWIPSSAQAKNALPATYAPLKIRY